MNPFFKKTILLFTLAGIVFLGGGVGVARAGDTPPVQQPATNNPGNKTPEYSATDNVAARVGQNTTALDLIQCGGFWDKLSLGCIMPVITYTLYVVINGVLILSSHIFDSILNLSIDKAFIEQPFVDTIWKVMRDFSNMMFIFILLFAGIRTMLFGDDWKRPVMMVVVIALLINFSLFFTKIVIDAGNILTVGVYSGLGVTKETPVSAAFSNVLKPQQYFEFSALKKDLAPTIFIIAGIVAGFLAYVLFKVALMFMGRILAFWFCMMFSPFAFILLAFPALATKIKFSFSAWLDILINQAFVAPVFLFFLYIILTIIRSGFFKSFGAPSDAGAFIDLIFIPVMSTAMLIYALKKALGVAESMSGEFGKIGADIGNKALGLAAMGTGVGLTAGVGAVAGVALRSDTLKGMVGSKNWAMSRIGAIAETGLKGAHEKPMDFRNISIGGKKLGEHLGIESFGLKKGYKQLKEEKTEEIAGRGKTASEARIAAQTTRKDAEKSAKDARTDAETKAKVTKEAKQTPVGMAAEQRKDVKRAYDSTPAGITAGTIKANEQEIRRQAKKDSVDNPFQTTPTSPTQDSLRDQLGAKKQRHDALQLEDTGGVVGGPRGTLSSLAEQADTVFEIAKATLDTTPISIPNPALAGVPATIPNPTQGAAPAYIPNPALAGVPATIPNPDRGTAVGDFTSAKTAKNTAEKKLKEFKEGADSIEKLEKKIEEYSAL